MKKVLIASIVFILIFGIYNTVFAVAEQQPVSQTSGVGVLPGARPELDCEDFMKLYEYNPAQARQNISEINDVLGCAVKTGRVHLWMLPFFITSLIRFLVSIAGLICVLFIVIGGYKYTMGGLTDDKESGKKTIRYAITGLIVVLLSWIVINVIQVQLTK